MNKTEIVCENVSKKYNIGKANEFTALKEINLKIFSGEFLSITGPSGSGKSTLLNLISCLDTPTSGEIYIEDIAVSKLNGFEKAKLRREKFGFVFQQFNLISGITTFENIELPMRFKGIPKEDRKRRVRELLSLVDLKDKEKNRPTELSGGEQQRVAIARALANNPEVILADEPTGNLDTKTGEKIIELLWELNKRENKTLIIITHDPLIAKKAKRLIKLKDGKIISDS
ncbi:MAG: ABC transporter ATP-binding protein [Candidatus Altiarchaeota archaeon]